MWTKDFSEIGKNDAAIAGGKGASLGELTQAGIRVPPGYVILSSAFEKFLETSDINIEINTILKTVNVDAMHTVEQASAQIQRLILEEKEIPKEIEQEILNSFKELDTEFVAVRSSATAEDSAEAAWAGQLDTFLNTTEKTLLHNVRECWASLFTPRAIFYRFEKELNNEHISVAVVVQKMVNSDSAGIAFSVHPVTEDRNQMIIEAGFGLGEAVVSGQITPDSYVVTKEPRKILDKNVIEQKKGLFRKQGGGNEWKETTNGSEQVLTDDEILKLSETILMIENHYGSPQDIEWAKEGSDMYVVQSRPITTLTNDTQTNSFVNELKNKDWQKDWEGRFSLLVVSIANGPTYIDLSEKLLGKALFSYLVFYKDTIASAWLPTTEYEECGSYLAKRFGSSEGAQELAQKFKAAADDAVALFQKPPEEFWASFDEAVRINETYTTYQIATKAVVNFLPLDADPSILEVLSEARKYSETFYKEMESFIKSAMSNIKSNTHSPEQLSMLSLDELHGYTTNGVLPEPKHLTQRAQRSGVYVRRGGLDELTGKEVELIQAAWSALDTEGELKGQSAYKGIVKGKCRIIKDFKRAEINEGEILVTGMTDPNFVPLMKKAAAIVTDGGGMLSHAAIVSRELKIPCVVGTKKATHILKNGDEVEVDANTGVVRILGGIDAINPDDYVRN